MAEDSTASVAEEILQLTQDALNLANVACHFDKIENYSGAYDYYDKCILSIDEVMSKLPPSSAQWHQLNVIRAQYDDRMDTLKEIEANRNSFFRSSESSTRLTREGSGGSGSKFGFRKKVLSQDDLNFTEIDILQQFTYEAPPASITDIPYWILRNVKRSIVSGAYIAENVFVPKPAWSQTDLKFAGIPAKTTAFEIVLRVVASIENMHISADDVSLSPLEVALHSAQEELLSLQNQLSKPFPYIKEIDTASITPINGSMHGFSGEDGTDTTNAGTVDGADEPRESMSTAGRSSVSTKQSTSANGASGNNGASEKDGGNNRTFSSLVSSFSKGVRKYAEVSFHRLAVALPSKLSSEELNDYTQLIVRVCDKSQLFAQWFRQMIDIRATLTAAMADNAGQSQFKTGFNPVMLQYKADNILQSLIVISGVMRDVFCEILLRDIEYLLDRYLLKTRKSYSRMYWDQDQGSESNS